MSRWGRKLDSVVSFRLGKDTHARVRELADADKLSVSDWIRRAVEREAAELAPVDLIAPDPSGVLHRVQVPAKLLRDAVEANLEAQAYRPRTFRCEHISIGGAVSAACGQCGPLAAVA